MPNKQNLSKEEIARRARQSALDKQRARTGGQKDFRKSRNVISGNRNTNGNNMRNEDVRLAAQDARERRLEMTQRLQTWLNPRAGIFRSYANEYEETALATFDTTITVTNGSANTLVCAIQPSAITATAAVFNGTTGALATGMIIAAASNGVQNCWPSALATVATNIASGPWSTGGRYPNPSLRFRVICAEIVVTPISNLSTISGAGCMSVINYNGYTNQQNTNSVWYRADGSFESQRYSRTFSAAEKVIAHYIPNGTETNFYQNVANSDNITTVGFYISGLAANTQFRIDVRTGIEYEPNQTFYPYVHTGYSQEDADVYHKSLQITMDSKVKNPMVVGKFDEWERKVNGLNVHRGGDLRLSQIKTIAYTIDDYDGGDNFGEGNAWVNAPSGGGGRGNGGGGGSIRTQSPRKYGFDWSNTTYHETMPEIVKASLEKLTPQRFDELFGHELYSTTQQFSIPRPKRKDITAQWFASTLKSAKEHLSGVYAKHKDMISDISKQYIVPTLEDYALHKVMELLKNYGYSELEIDYYVYTGHLYMQNFGKPAEVQVAVPTFEQFKSMHSKTKAERSTRGKDDPIQSMDEFE